MTKIVEMAHGLGIKVICEGVETKDQIEILRKIGVRYVQGYYYSRPIPGAKFLEQFCELDSGSEEAQEKARVNEEKARELVAAETEKSARIHEDADTSDNADD